MKQHLSTRSIILVGVALALCAVAAGTAFWDRVDEDEQTAAARVDAVCRLADDRSEGAAEAIAAAAGDEDASVRRAAMVALGKIGAGEHRSVIEAGARDVDPTVRACAAAALGRLADDDAVVLLGDILTGETDEQIRVAAVTGLALAGLDRAIVLLVEAAEKDSSHRVKLRAMAVLTHRYGIRFHDPPSPADTDAWARAMSTIRKIPGVRKACGDIPAPARGGTER
jgi:HEAT repeat protein